MSKPTIDPLLLKIFGPPPPGLDLTEEKYTVYDIASAIVYAVAIASVALRLYVRRRMGPRLGADDYAIVISTLCNSATLVMLILAGNYGASTHIWANELLGLIKLLKVVYSQPCIYALAVTTTKISILLFYRRLYYSKSAKKSAFFFLYWAAVGLTAAYPVVLWITMACACRPISFYWNQYIGAEGSCIDLTRFFLAVGIVNMLNDIFILFVPIPRIIDLHLTKRLKASVIGIMMLGGLVCLASIVRIYYLHGLFVHHDPTWWLGSAMAWSSIEPSVAIISACLPTFAPLFRVRRSSQKGSSPFNSSGRTNISKPGTQFGSRNKRSSLRVGKPNTRKHGTSFTSDDDEVELTSKGMAVGSISSLSHDLERKGRMEDERAIIVSTEVTVVTSEREEFIEELFGTRVNGLR
ncbi:hypothetical protein BGZ63DRAFT_431366 [Mariannaea sp. PMI_226]|nr:hypothetical protein BGZ63DRAFT_431366 [Mariannaea sp. PMI_226]